MRVGSRAAYGRPGGGRELRDVEVDLPPPRANKRGTGRPAGPRKTSGTQWLSGVKPNSSAPPSTGKPARGHGRDACSYLLDGFRRMAPAGHGQNGNNRTSVLLMYPRIVPSDTFGPRRGRMPTRRSARRKTRGAMGVHQDLRATETSQAPTEPHRPRCLPPAGARRYVDGYGPLSAPRLSAKAALPPERGPGFARRSYEIPLRPVTPPCGNAASVLTRAA